MSNHKTVDYDNRSRYVGVAPLLTYIEFRNEYCEYVPDVTKPKFSVGDKVRIVNIPASDFNNFIGEVVFVTENNVSVKFSNRRIEFLSEFVEPYIEPETKPTEDMETKDLNLCELLKEYKNVAFYSPIFGYIKFKYSFSFTSDYQLEFEHGYSFSREGKFYNDKDSLCMLFPSRELYLRYPLEPKRAWDEWSNEKKEYEAEINCQIDANGHLVYEDTKRFLFRTEAERDQCIDEIKAIIEKYSKK